jgi:integrase
MSRRGNGEGSIRQRADGRWEARARLPTGERASFYGWTRAEVTEAAAKALSDARLGVRVGDGRQPYSAYLASWLEARKPDIAESTYRSYEANIRLHIEPALGATRLCDLTPQRIQLVYTRMRAAGMTVVSVARAVMTKSLNDALRQGFIVRNPAPLAVGAQSRGHLRAQTFHVYDPDEARRYLDVALARAQPGKDAGKPASRYGPLLALMLLTGIRIGEASALRWRDVHLNPASLARSVRSDPSIQVLGTMRYLQGDPVFSVPKTARSRRSITLSAEAVELLTSWRARQREEWIQRGPAWRTTWTATRDGHDGEVSEFADLVFTDELGAPAHQSRVGYHHRQIARLADVPLIRPHDLRHTFATLLLRAGVNPKIVSEMLGHASVAFTLSVYSHVLPDMQRDAIASLTRLLGE